MFLSSQALWPSENSVVAHNRVTVHRLKTSGLSQIHGLFRFFAFERRIATDFTNSAEVD